MLRYFLFLLLAAAGLMALPGQASAQFDYSLPGSPPPVYIPIQGGFLIIPQAPRAKHDRRIDPHLVKAARLADAKAFPHSTLRCWMYVKDALLAAGAVTVRPTSNYACQAGAELMSRYGFVRLPIHNPYGAPLGAVLVYSGGTAGHVEIRTEDGFASDYHSHWACRYKLIGVYAKLSA